MQFPSWKSPRPRANKTASLLEWNSQGLRWWLFSAVPGEGWRVVFSSEARGSPILRDGRVPGAGATSGLLAQRMGQLLPILPSQSPIHAGKHVVWCRAAGLRTAGLHLLRKLPLQHDSALKK